MGIVPLLNMARFDKLDSFQKLFTFLVIERFLFVMKITATSLLPEKSVDIQLLLDRQRYVLDKLRFITQRRKGSVAREAQFAGSVSAPITLDEKFVDWEFNQGFNGDCV